MGRDDAQAIQRAISELQQASQAMAQHLQGEQQPVGAGARGSGGAGQARQGGGPDDIIDADFEVKK